jgi:hypothetical protein
MTSTVKHNSERDGYRIQVIEYTVKGKTRYSARITNLTTQHSVQEPGFTSYTVALEYAQEHKI